MHSPNVLLNQTGHTWLCAILDSVRNTPKAFGSVSGPAVELTWSVQRRAFPRTSERCGGPARSLVSRPSEFALRAPPRWTAELAAEFLGWPCVALPADSTVHRFLPQVPCFPFFCCFLTLCSIMCLVPDNQLGGCEVSRFCAEVIDARKSLTPLNSCPRFHV